MTAYQFSQPWLSKMNDPDWMPTAQEFASLRNYLKGLDDGTIKLFNPSFVNPLSVSNGGTGASTLTGYVKGTGTAALTGQAVPIPVADGGTNSTTGLASGLLMVSSGGKIVEIAGNTSAGSNKITSLAAPTSNGDALRYPAITAWKSDLTFTPNNFGTISASSFLYRQVGDSMEVNFFFKAGTTAASVATISLPITVDTTKVPSSTKKTVAGIFFNTNGGGGSAIYASSVGGVMYFDPTETTNIHFSISNGSDAGGEVLVGINASAFLNTNGTVTGRFTVPVSGWGL